MPRLTAAVHDHGSLNRLVNEQTEMGVLIAVPGVLGTLTLAPWVMHVLYSSAFVQGAEVARWQILGVFLRVLCWPLGYVLIAKRKSLLFTLTELAFGMVNVGLILVCMKWWRLEGLGISFALSYLVYTVMMVAVVWRLTGFRWSATAARITGAHRLGSGGNVCRDSLFARNLESLPRSSLDDSGGDCLGAGPAKATGLESAGATSRQIRIGKVD